MAQQLSLRVGETNQLRPHGEVERWASDCPRVVEVSDEDVVNGRPGGLLTAKSPGQARVTAFSPGGERLVEVDVTVEGAQVITLAAGATAPPGALPGAGRWTSTRPQVAAVDAGGDLRGVGPGVALLLQEGTGVELQVRVTGEREVGVNQSLALVDYFAIDVRDWRAGSSAVTINNHGVAVAGDRPRTVPVFATLQDGSEFSFDLRIVRTPGDAPDPIPVSSRQSSTPPAQSQAASPTITPTISQRQEVEAHLERAEALLQQRHWQQAGAELMAADLAATGDDGLRARVRAARELLRASVLEGAAAGCADAAAAIRRSEFTRARELLRDLRIPTGQSSIVSELNALADALEAITQNVADSDVQIARLPARLDAAWRAAQAANMPGALAEIAAVAVAWGTDEIAPLMISHLASEKSAGYPAPMRAALESSLLGLGDAALTELLRRLSATAHGDAAGQWLLGLLANLNPAKRANLITQFYRRLPPPAQTLLVEWLSVMAAQSYGVVLDLMAGVLRKLPPDPALAKALRDRIGARALEESAVKWAAGGHKGAREVLMRLYNYPASAFDRG